MSWAKIFPESGENELHPLELIARRLRCDSSVVVSMILGVGTPEWSTTEHLQAVKDTTHQLNEAARHAANLNKSLMRLSENQRQFLMDAATVTPQQIGHLVAVLSDDAASLDLYGARFNRVGGRNPAAHIIAEGMRRVFRRLRRPITYGQHPGGGPSTDFGREIEFALGAFGLKTDWRRPTEAAAQTQRLIQERLSRCLAEKQRKEGLKTGWDRLDLSGVTIETTTSNGKQAFLISLTKRPDIPPLCVAASMFSSGREVEAFAFDWSTRNQLHNPNAK